MQQIAQLAQLGLLKGHSNGLFQNVRICDVNVGDGNIGFLVARGPDAERSICAPYLNLSPR
ncbi:hypothetical protein NMYAN_230029 [Nitrosomonas nitrosa]|uniref:Uncharacterized protein n=1 Tax=Nitrosomonas nitrosa TaxID=52442 RepID=A0A8H8YZQ7_9PROT|nr:hypothetical protein NMYAN_230029 [Nitrosomonas nitrosa]